MRKRWRLWLGIALAASLILGAVIAYGLWNADPIRYENFAQIRVGMTRAEVEALLGCPSGDYASGPLQFDQIETISMVRVTGHIPDHVDEQGRAWAEWHGNHGCITVRFDVTGHVSHHVFFPGRPAPSKWRRWIEDKLGW